MKIYTKTGDSGQTSFFDGTRVSKSHDRVDLYGEIDELNSLLGLAMSFCKDDRFKTLIQNEQKNLFALGAKLANPAQKKQKDKADFDNSKITALEKQIDEWEQTLEPMKTFILPGGSSVAASLHQARCVCRRAERKLVNFANTNTLNEIYLTYLNRLSDYLFVAARFANSLDHTKDIPWE